MVKIVFGMMGGSVNRTNILDNPTLASKLLDLLKSHNIKEIDTARVYGTGASETMLGQLSAPKTFQISTKAPAFTPGSLSPPNIRKNCEASLKALGTQKLDIYYTHGPDSATPFEEQCATMNELYKEGKFERYGISNLTSKQIQEVYDICKARDFVLPTVYQGGYNPILRTADRTRLPVCRKLGISFYAYSPLAGGFLAKPLSEILNPIKGSRFDAMSVFGEIYCTPAFIAGVEKLKTVLDEFGLEVRNATLRWLMHHSPLGPEDAVILGASSFEQAEMNLGDCDGGVLPERVVGAMEELWDSIKDVKVAYEPEM